MKPTQVLFCVCHYRNSTEVIAFVESCLKFIPQARFAVCDNSADYGAALPPSTSLYTPERTLGYLNGCSFALDRWSKEYGLAELVVVSNTDLIFDGISQYLLPELLHAEGVAGYAPHIQLQSNGRPQNPHLLTRPSLARLLFLRAIHANSVSGAMYMRLSALRSEVGASASEPDASSRASGCTVYAPHGSMFVLHPSFFKRCQLSFQGFMHDEEWHLGETVRRAGLRWQFEPRWRMIHQHHANLSSVSLRRQSQWHRSSLKFIHNRYYLAPHSGS